MGPLIARTIILGLLCFGPVAFVLLKYKSFRKEHFKIAILLSAAATLVFCFIMFIMFLEGQ